MMEPVQQLQGEEYDELIFNSFFVFFLDRSLFEKGASGSYVGLMTSSASLSFALLEPEDDGSVTGSADFV